MVFLAWLCRWTAIRASDRAFGAGDPHESVGSQNTQFNVSRCPLPCRALYRAIGFGRSAAAAEGFTAGHRIPWLAWRRPVGSKAQAALARMKEILGNFGR
jgi:hypothetical protein